MKKTLTLLLISLSSVTSAQNNQEQEYNAMVENFARQMKQIEACQSKVDKAKLEQYKQLAKLNDEKIEALCINNRDKAEELDNSFMQEGMKDPEIEVMLTCIMNITDNDSIESDDDSEDIGHVCD
tara:strand:- start:8924 stop:9298 length:375 start_codon:yes stop_codon:yes gene_type:complete